MMTEVPDLDVFVDTKNYEEGLRDILGHIRPEWNREDIKFKALQDGHINLMQAAFIEEERRSDWVVARIFDTKIEAVEQFGFAKQYEFKAAKLFSEIGVGPRLLATFKNGMVMAFVQATTHSWADSDLVAFRENPKLIKAVARTMAKVHSQETKRLAVEKYGIDKAPTIYDVCKQFSGYDWSGSVLVDEETNTWFNSKVPPVEQRQAEFSMIAERMRDMDIPETFCHMDSNPTNLLYIPEEDRVVLVDFESSVLAKPTFDFSTFLDTVALGVNGNPFTDRLSHHKQRDFILMYLAERNRLDTGSDHVDEKELDKYCDYNQAHQCGMSFFTHIIMATLVQAGSGKNYLQAGVNRLDYYWKNKDRMISLFDKYQAKTA